MIRTELFAPLLAVDADSVIAAIIAIFSVIGWIIKVVSSSQQTPAAPVKGANPKPVNRPKSIDDEINIFLEEVGKPGTDAKRPAEAGQRARGERKRGPQERSRGAAPARPVPASPSQRRKATTSIGRELRQPEGEPSAPRSPAEKSAGRMSRPGEAIANRSSPASGNLGNQVQQHLQQYMADRISTQVSNDLSPRIAETVAAHLGTVDPPPGAATVARPPTHPLLIAMRNPESVRQGMLISLILGPPVSRGGQRSPLAR